MAVAKIDKTPRGICDPLISAMELLARPQIVSDAILLIVSKLKCPNFMVIKTVCIKYGARLEIDSWQN